MHGNRTIVAGEPANDKRSALQMLPWSIKAKIALKAFITPRISTSLS
jgi:hypothetical protein